MAGLLGGYRLPYDPRPALRAIESDQGAEAAWSELWEELHHQGDVDIGSYVALTAIARLTAAGKAGGWNAFQLAYTIELARTNDRNPPIPEWLAPSYSEAWAVLSTTALTVLRDAGDPDVVSSAMAVVALQKQLPVLARVAAEFSEAERLEILNKGLWG